MSHPSLEQFSTRAEAAEEEIRQLKRDIELLKMNLPTNAADSANNPNEELVRLQQENVKLKHRVAILKRAVIAQKAKNNERNPNAMISIYDTLYDLFEKAILTAYPDISEPPVVISTPGKGQKCDYQCNSAMPLNKLLATRGQKCSPQEIAKNIVGNIESSVFIEKVEVAGPGFINIYLNREYGLTALNALLRTGKVAPPSVRKCKVVIDFSSPNVAKEMHVGHLRSTIIGDSIARLLEYLGHNVLRINHIGDWGTQFGMLIAHLQDRFPDYLTVSPPISDLQTFYKESKTRFDEDEEFKKRAYSCVVKLQAFDPNMIKAWQLICDVSRKEFQKLYERLDISLIERGESFYQKHMEKLVKELESKNFLEEDEGRKVMWGEKEGIGIPLTIVKSDGGFTYDTSDMAALKQRVEEELADWIVYVTDAGQAVHFQTLEKCAKRAGFLQDRHNMVHVGFGVVLGEDKKKFKTRSGDTVKLSDLLDEGLKRALEKLKDKQRDSILSKEEIKAAQESIAYGCIKYADLSHNRGHEYIFSFDKMLEDKGNTAVYLLYALTRIRSIARTVNLTREELKELAQTTSVTLDHEKEWKLAKVLLKFPDVILRISKDFYIHTLCEYCYEIACTFTEFYDSCYCIEKNRNGEVTQINMERILLSEATAIVMEQCFSLLGLKPVERM